MFSYDPVQKASKRVQLISGRAGEKTAEFVDFHRSAFVHQDL